MGFWGIQFCSKTHVLLYLGILTSWDDDPGCDEFGFVTWTGGEISFWMSKPQPSGCGLGKMLRSRIPLHPKKCNIITSVASFRAKLFLFLKQLGLRNPTTGVTGTKGCEIRTFASAFQLQGLRQ